jgi:hypothetical protein
MPMILLTLNTMLLGVSREQHRFGRQGNGGSDEVSSRVNLGGLTL